MKCDGCHRDFAADLLGALKNKPSVNICEDCADRTLWDGEDWIEFEKKGIPYTMEYGPNGEYHCFAKTK